PELLADVGRVMDADVEIGVVADQAWHMEAHFALADQAWLDVVAIALVAEDLLQPQAKRALRFGAARQPGIQHRLDQIVAHILVEAIGYARKIKHIVADRNAGTASPFRLGKYCERQ